MTEPVEGLPYDRRLDRFNTMVATMRAFLLAVGVLAALGAVTPSEMGRWFGGAAIAVLVAAPLIRVVWLVARWFRRGDPRFALVGTGVLAIIAIGVGLAAIGV